MGQDLPCWVFRNYLLFTQGNTKKVTTTPLLEYLKQRKQEKLRLKNEKREERRHRDQERRRAKDEPMISKVINTFVSFLYFVYFIRQTNR